MGMGFAGIWFRGRPLDADTYLLGTCGLPGCYLMGRDFRRRDDDDDSLSLSFRGNIRTVEWW